jgi:hypothetical protein
VPLSASSYPSLAYQGQQPALGCTYRENKKHIKILCGTDCFRYLGKNMGRITRLQRCTPFQNTHFTHVFFANFEQTLSLM